MSPYPPLSSRRRLLEQAAAVGAGSVVAACTRVQDIAPTIRWRVQTVWDAGTVGFSIFQRFCASIKNLTRGQLELEALAPGSVANQLNLVDAVREGKCEACNGFIASWASRTPAGAFLSSYPLGLDRPDHWETWYHELGGLALARRVYQTQGVYLVGIIQHDLNLIHSRVPIRRFEDFKGKRIRFPGGMIADVFEQAGASTVLLPGSEVYPELRSGRIDAADYVGPAVNYGMGFADIAKYIVMGPRNTPCLHQPVDLLDLAVNLDRWRELSSHLQTLLTTAVRQFSWDHYAAIQRENLVAWEKMLKKGIEVLCLSEEDVLKLRRVAIPIWFKWARKDPLAREALESQLRFMRSQNVDYLTDDMLKDSSGRKLEL